MDLRYVTGMYCVLEEILGGDGDGDIDMYLLYFLYYGD